MKKLVMFLLGLIILGIAGVAIYLTGGIYDAGVNQNVVPYFFQPNNLSERRPGVPLSPEYLGDAQLLDMLVKKYITEYFSVSPDVENVARRTRSDSPLALMSAESVFDEWSANTGQEIQKMASDGEMRIVRVIDKIYQPSGSQYWVVSYELTTWERPNDFRIAPVVTRGTMYMNITYKMEMREGVDVETLHKYLEQGGDPSPVFYFRVNKIIQG